MNYDQVFHKANNLPPIKDEKLHNCRALLKVNRIRDLIGESRVFIFEDFESCQYNMKVGLEFVELKYCPFCGRKLC